MKEQLFKTIDKAIQNRNFSHAYLLMVDDLYKTEISKYLVNKISKEQENNVEESIDEGLSSDLKIIRPEGAFIKKNQIMDLISEFKSKSINNNIRFYIIEYAENLNPFSSNALLKFLEEPEDNIIAILVTKNINSVLPTIVSRCQTINLNYYNNEVLDKDVIERAKKYLFEMIKEKNKSIVYLNELYNLKADEVLNILSVFPLLYEEIINNCYFVDNEENFIKKDEFNNIKNTIKLDEITSLLKRSEKAIEYLKYNVNVRIALDYLILGGE